MPLVPVSQRAGYTLEEVAQHCTEKSLWVIINRKVYDMTTFYKRHPGGQMVLLQMGGRDATAASAAAHKNALPANLMWEFCIGSLVRFKAKPPEPAALPAQALPAQVPAATSPGATSKAKTVVAAGFSTAKDLVAGGGKILKKAAVAKEPATKKSERPPSEGSELHGAEQGSSQGNLDDEFLEVALKEDSIHATADFLLEKLKTEPSLVMWAQAIDSTQLEQALLKFLGGAFEGADWPQLHIKRSLVEAHFAELVESLWECLKGRLPLGEDPVTHAVRKMATVPETADDRIARFFEAIRDLVFVNGITPVASIKNLPSLRGLAGTWKNTDGLLCTVSDCRCTFNSKITSTITAENGLLVLNGWTAVTMSSKAVQWEKGDKTMDWLRVDEHSPKSVREANKVPNGVWQNTEGLVCTVSDHICTFVTKGAYSFGAVDGMPTLNGWRATMITSKSVQWDKGGKRMEWLRFKHAKDLPVLEGTWKNSEGLVCTVAAGICTFSKRGDHPLSMKDGVLTLNNWRATAITTDTVSWQKGDSKMRWDRLENEALD